MIRSGYNEEHDTWAMIRWRGAVASSIRGRRGQALLRDMLTSLDEMSDKRLVPNELVSEGGGRCALGVVGKLRGIDVAAIDPEDSQGVALSLGVSELLVREIVHLNDELCPPPWRVRKRSHYRTPDGLTWMWMRDIPPELRDSAEHVAEQWIDPTPEEIEASERLRWQEVRAWVEANLRGEEST